MKNLKNKTAFSLIELSIVILVIGIIIAGITQSSRLIAQFRLTTARSMTESSPASSIKGLVQWYEATSVASFDDDETEDHDLVADAPGIATWYDINQTDGTRKNATNATADEQPFYYADCINDLPCVRFNGTDNSLDFDGSNIVGSDYTIFAVVQRRAAAANYFIGTSLVTSENNSLGFGYTATDTLMLSQGDITAAYTVEIADFSTPTPQLHTMVNNSATIGSDSFSHYLNGSATVSTVVNVGTPNLNSLQSYPSAALGVHHNGTSLVYFNGDIGEIIIYNRALKTEERIAVEDYLDKKWKIN